MLNDEVIKISTIAEENGYIECGGDWFFRDKKTMKLKAILKDSCEVLEEDMAKELLVLNRLNDNKQYDNVVEKLNINKNNL